MFIEIIFFFNIETKCIICGKLLKTNISLYRFNFYFLTFKNNLQCLYKI